MSMLQNKSTKEIFRDCLKLVPKMIPSSQNIKPIRELLKREFLRNKDETDAEKIENLRRSAIRGISNYLIFTVKREYDNNPAMRNMTIYDQDPEEEAERRR